jgi:hypothetical protein
MRPGRPDTWNSIKPISRCFYPKKFEGYTKHMNKKSPEVSSKDRQLQKVRKAYDLTVEQYQKGISPLDDLPEDIKDTPFGKILMTEEKFLVCGA